MRAELEALLEQDAPPPAVPGYPLDLTVLLAAGAGTAPAALHATLDSLRQVDRRGLRWQLLLADGGAGEPTTGGSAWQAGALPLQRVAVPGAGPVHCAGRALAQARGAVTLIIEAGMQLPADALRQWLEGSRRSPQAALWCGATAPLYPDDCRDWMCSGAAPLQPSPEAHGAGGALPRSFPAAFRTGLLRIHGLREARGDAAAPLSGAVAELCARLQALGHAAAMLPDAVTEVPLDACAAARLRALRAAWDDGRRDEFRRALAGDWDRETVLLRARLWLPAVLAALRLWRGAAAGGSDPLQRVESLRGRLQQLQALLAAPARLPARQLARSLGGAGASRSGTLLE